MDKRRALVFLNKGHSLFPQQQECLDNRFGVGNWGFQLVPEEGWTYDEQVALAMDLQRSFVGPKWLGEEDGIAEGFTFVFASPVPALLVILARASGKRLDFNVEVFHNDRRVAKEVPDGKGGKRVVHTVAPDGWILV